MAPERLDDERLAAVAKAQQERARTLKEMAANSVFFFRDVTAYEQKAATKNLTPDSAPTARGRAGAARRDARVAGARDPRRDQRRGGGAGRRARQVAQPVRVAVAGGTVSPPIDVTLAILGREETLARLDRAVAYARG